MSVFLLRDYIRKSVITIKPYKASNAYCSSRHCRHLDDDKAST